MLAPAFRRWYAPAAVLTVAALFACLKGGEPTDANARDVQFGLAAQVVGSGPATLHVTVVYLDQSTTTSGTVPVTLLDKRLSVTAGTQNLPLTIDITRCLADPRHTPAGSSCTLLAGVTLIENGAVIDSVTVGPVLVTPGQTVNASTSLTPIGRIDVYPTSASINVGQTAQLYDTVFAPSDTVLSGVAVTWTSRNTSVATVDTSGLVTGVGAGTTTVVATAGNQSDSATITVAQVSTGGGGISVFPTVTFSAPVGGTIPVAAYLAVTATVDTSTVGNLVATITPSSATAWLVANVSDSSLGSVVTKRPAALRAMGTQLRAQQSGVTTPATLDVHPTTTTLAAGTYNATVTITGNGGASATVSITYTLSAPQADLEFNPNELVFTQYDYGAVAAAQTAYATNSGAAGTTLGQLSESGSISYSGPDTGWLSLSVSDTTLTLQPTTSVLALGTESASIPFTAANAGNNPQNLEVEVTSAVTYTKVVLGAAFGCGLTTANTVYCWGGDGQGELGDGGTDESVATPVHANIPTAAGTIYDIEAGAYHACALMASGAIYCWGRNQEGELGIGTTSVSVSTPTLISGHTYASITLGTYHTCGVEGTAAGNTGANYVDCWGSNTDGQFGNGTQTTTAQTSPTNTGLIYAILSAGNNYTCGINNPGVAGNLYCWGEDGNGQLGNTYEGDTYDSPQYVNVLTPDGGPAVLTSVSAGNITTCALDNAGNAYCWGDDVYGEVGNGATSSTPVTSPTLVSGGYSWTSISAGETSVCGIASTGDYCWGYDNYGQLGNGTVGNTSQPSPTPVIGSGESLFTEFIVGGVSQSGCYITGSIVSCFGLDGNGQLGIGLIAQDEASPTQMVGQPSTVESPSRVVRRKVVKATAAHPAARH
jgi:alpha-tubulin suppressor-like RCC1 family protein